MKMREWWEQVVKFFKWLWSLLFKPETVIVKDPEFMPEVLRITPKLLKELEKYSIMIKSRRQSTFRIAEKMRYYYMGQHVVGYRNSMSEPPIEGYVLKGFYYPYGGGYFMIRKDTKRIIQVCNVVPFEKYHKDYFQSRSAYYRGIKQVPPYKEN